MIDRSRPIGTNQSALGLNRAGQLPRQLPLGDMAGLDHDAAGAAPGVRLILPIALALLATASWLVASMGTTDPLLGLQEVQGALDTITVVAGGIAAVLLLGRLVVSIAGHQATGFHRAVIYLLLTFVTSFLVMRHFGFDLQAILATSAILTAAVGFAMQPTLGTMIAGFTLHLDGIVRVGDGMVHDGELVRIVAMNWRSVTARRSAGTLVMVPNSQISDRITEVLRDGQSLRITVLFVGPLHVPPQRITTLVTDAIADFALVDAGRPVAVGPVGAEPAQALMRYRLRCSILTPFDRQDAESEIQRRLWYVFQRNEIILPISRLFAEPRAFAAPTVESTVLAGWVRSALQSTPAVGYDTNAVEALVRGGRLLMYAPDERLVLPEETDDWQFLLVRGQAVDSHEYGLDEADPRRPTLPSWSFGPDAAVRHVAEQLARHIGPYAEIAVRRAARATGDLRALCQAVATEIDNPVDRATFLANVAPADDSAPHGPGLVFRARRNAAGTLICHLALRAQTEVIVIGVRPGLLQAALSGGSERAAE